MHGTAFGLGGVDQDVDGLIPQSELQAGDQLQPLALRLGKGRVGFDEEVDVSTKRGMIESRSEQPEARLGAEDLARGTADELCGLRQAADLLRLGE
ncbi:MAG: hypothetical protein KAX46_11335 [Chromatiaceae bacterium]|nr:hypothetical protein [Chromatiaceae bacterium]